MEGTNGWRNACGRAQAESLVLAGSVFVDGQQAAYAGEPVKADARIAVKGSERKYAGKGGLKLEGALRHFQLGVTGRIALDAGASTGGFTDCLLPHGAAQVYSVDVGGTLAAGSACCLHGENEYWPAGAGDASAEAIACDA